jgi:nucleoside-diphosphate-sugar epimerase
VRVLIVGGTGLFSTSVTQQLVERGERVTLFNRGKTASRLPDGTGPVGVITGDRTDYPAFEASVREAGSFDCVIDTVGYRPEDAASLARAFAGRVGQVIFCSTTSVYPTPASCYPVNEREPPTATLPYGANKARCERLLMDAHERGDFQVTILRPAHIYGEGRGMLNTLGSGTAYFDRLRRGKAVVVHGDGTSLWSALHAHDVARAFVGAVGNGAAGGRVLNVAAEEWLSWNGYNEQVAEAAGAPSPEIVHIPTDVLARLAPEAGRRCKESYQFSKIFDTSAAQEVLGFRQRMPFLEGVRRTIAWLDERGAVENWETEPWYDEIVDRWRRTTDRLVGEVLGETVGGPPR